MRRSATVHSEPYAVLMRYRQSSGQRMPGRLLLAARLRTATTATVDRALKELITVGAVAVEHRHEPLTIGSCSAALGGSETTRRLGCVQSGSVVQAVVRRRSLRP